MISKYLNRLYDSIISRGYIEIEWLDFDTLPGQQGIIEGRLNFHDGSLLDFDEVIIVRNDQLIKLRYAYHYQGKSGDLIFRYDNAPHYPDISTYPHHKHIGTQIDPSQIPDLNDVLRKIEELIFGNKQSIRGLAISTTLQYNA